MIEDIVHGDIMDPRNKRDVIIGMNTAFDDVRGIGKPFVDQYITTRKVAIGSVVSFELDETRELHMLICHELGLGGWEGAEMFVRFGMDHLWHENKSRKGFSIVRIGTGRVGQRDGANHSAILGAMVNSHLPALLYVLDERESVPAQNALRVLPFKPLRTWSRGEGIVPIRLAA